MACVYFDVQANGWAARCITRIVAKMLMPMLMPMPINTKRCSLFFSILQVNGLWGQLTALKKVVTEPKGTGEAFDAVMKEYYSAIRKGQGGLFMAVCRGKVHTVCLCLIACDQQYAARFWHSDSSQLDYTYLTLVHEQGRQSLFFCGEADVTAG